MNPQTPQSPSIKQKPSLLLILPRFPYPPIGGDKLKSFHLIQILSRHFELSLICIAQSPLSEEEEAFCKQYFTRYEVVYKTRFQHLRAALKALYSPLPLQVCYYSFSDIASRIQRASAQCEIVLNTLVRTAPYVLPLPHIKVLDMVDSLFLNYARARKSSVSLLHRIYYAFESKRLQRYERECVKHYDLSLFVNGREAEHYAPYGRVLCLPNGVDSALLHSREILPQYRHCIAFCGKMDYQPNIDAMLWFIHNVLPKLHKAITLLIIGANPTKALTRLQSERVKITGYLPDVHTPIYSCFGALAPMRSGGGIQNKILESMALGRVVVTTTLGASPITHAQDRTHLLICDEADSMAHEINALYTTPQAYAHIGRNARALVASHYSWERYERALIDSLFSLLENTRGGAELEFFLWIVATPFSPSLLLSLSLLLFLFRLAPYPSLLVDKAPSLAPSVYSSIHFSHSFCTPSFSFAFSRAIALCHSKSEVSSAESAQQIDCHDSASAESRNDKGADSPTTSAQNAVSLEKPTPTNTPQDSRIFDESKNTPARGDFLKKLRFEAKNGALRGLARELPQAVMTERTNSAKNLKNHTPTETPQDSRICEEKSGLSSASARSYLSGSDEARARGIADFNRKDRIPLVFISNTCFGMYNFRLHSLRSLRDEGYAIHIIAPYDSSTPKLTSEGFICHHIRLDSRSLNPCKDLRTAMSLFTLLRRIRPALIFNYTIKPAIYGSLIARGLKIPYIAVITGLGYVFINDRGEASSPKKKLLRALVCALYRKALKNAKEVWFLNRDDRAEFLTRRLITQEQARLLPSEGVDTAHFAPSLKSDTGKDTDKSTNKEGGQNEECFTFLLIARMLWDKGVGEFVEAAQILRNEIKQDSHKHNKGVALKLRFILLGSVGVANPSAISRETIAQWEAQGLVEYLGEAGDVRPYIESASCVVLPSYREGAPMVLLESMSMGKPIITTDVSGCRDCIAPPLTPLPLIQALQTLAPFAPLTAQNLAQDSHSPAIESLAKQSTKRESKGIDCHDSASTESRNDNKNTESQSPPNTPEDSRIPKETATNALLCDKAENAQAQAKSQAAGFCDDFCGCQARNEGATLSVVTEIERAGSAKSAQKPTPQILLGVNGVLIPPRNAPSLAQAMRAMLKLDSHARKELGANARELALRHHDKRLITRLYLHTAQKHASSLPPKQP